MNYNDSLLKKRIEEFTANDFFRDINFINSTINETNKIEKKLFNLTEENTTELITIKNNIEELNGKTIHKDCKIKIYKNFQLEEIKISENYAKNLEMFNQNVLQN